MFSTQDHGLGGRPGCEGEGGRSCGGGGEQREEEQDSPDAARVAKGSRVEGANYFVST